MAEGAGASFTLTCIGTQTGEGALRSAVGEGRSAEGVRERSAPLSETGAPLRAPPAERHGGGPSVLRHSLRLLRIVKVLRFVQMDRHADFVTPPPKLPKYRLDVMRRYRYRYRYRYVISSISSRRV